MFNNKNDKNEAPPPSAAQPQQPPSTAFHPFQMVPTSNAANRLPKTTPITDDYEISTTVLGQGINGKVVECIDRRTGTVFALKVKLSK